MFLNITLGVFILFCVFLVCCVSEMEPKTVGVVLTCLVTLTTCLYFFAIPESLTHAGKVNTVETVQHFWGTPDSEFNWCELDYVVHPWIAEFYNVLTSVLYVAISFASILVHDSLQLARGHKCAMLAIGAVGVGSALFHGTLRYHMQLLDELPMHWLVTISIYNLYYRNEHDGLNVFREFSTVNLKPQPLLTSRHAVSLLLGMEILLTLALFTTERLSAFHQLLRGIMSVTFSLFFVFIFVASSALANETDIMLRLESGHTHGLAPSTLFAAEFGLFVTAIVFWVTDIVLCEQLHSSPFGLPYLHLHACWHVLTALGLHLALVLSIYHQKVFQRGSRAVHIAWFGQLLPFVTEAHDSLN